MTEIRLREAQEKVLAYAGGYMAVSAVPGSGKTFTLTRLASRLIAEGQINPDRNQQILIVTYLNSSVETFKARIKRRLEEIGLPPVGYDVRTLHSLSLEIVRSTLSGDTVNAPIVIDDAQSSHFLARAIDQWVAQYPELWAAFLPNDAPQTRVRWRDLVQKTAKRLIQTAKNERLPAAMLLARIQEVQESADWRFLFMLVGIYANYQAILNRQGALDYDDQIWQAADLLDQNPGLAEQLRQRWPFVLEDEAQDSVPLQEVLLQQLTGAGGNWVRVGDPNQAITSTFTASDPAFFNAFLERDDVQDLPLPNSGRSAPLIIGAANALVDWACDKHPVPEVRANAFRRQYILPTEPGDPQPNPPDAEAFFRIKVYQHREDEEIPDVIRLARVYTEKYPKRTVAILVSTNLIGQAVSERLDALDIGYDSLLKSGTRERQVAAALHAVLALLAEPLNTRILEDAYAALREIGHPAAVAPADDAERFDALLRSVHSPERFLFPVADGDLAKALPTGIATDQDVVQLDQFAAFLQRVFELRPLPIDDLVLALGDELFAFAGAEANEGDLAVAYQLANMLRGWRDTQPSWRLPELAAQLSDLAEGRRQLRILSTTEEGFEPRPGRITLATQHSAKGLEWDAVFLIGIDGFWVPSTLESYFQGVNDAFDGDPSAEAVAQLRRLMQGDAADADGLSPTDSAHAEIICERLRLLYVGVTRAKRMLQISRSRVTRSYQKERDAEPTTALAALYEYKKALEK